MRCVGNCDLAEDDSNFISEPGMEKTGISLRVALMAFLYFATSTCTSERAYPQLITRGFDANQPHQIASSLAAANSN
ncbi:hypothetical protein DAI22_05g218470 [Oryza sativa Japonica Group]|nr:hypothetical protein DAI22_05g218470 [Oryza sativa Japonica Group]